MQRKLLIALLLAAIGATVVAAGAFLAGNETSTVPERAGKTAIVQVPPESQPDTKSSNWRYLSDDVGMMIRHDERLGLRGRLYVRTGGVWLPVATDTTGDLAGTILVK